MPLDGVGDSEGGRSAQIPTLTEGFLRVKGCTSRAQLPVELAIGCDYLPLCRRPIGKS